MTPWFWTSSALTDVGRERSLNEDAFLDGAERRLWAVADGMGGHDAGDVASRCVIDALAALEPAADLETYTRAVRDSLEQANSALLDLASTRPGAIVGSTVVALCQVADQVAVLWAGDSRAYRLRDGVLEQVTIDHSRVQELVDRGLIRPEDAETHPQANVITRAIGVARPLQIDSRVLDLADDDCFLLCSDGLSRCVSADDLRQALTHPVTRTGCRMLLDQALAAGAPDNVTLVVARCREDTQSATVFNPDARAGEDLTGSDATLLADPPDESDRSP